jgi:hypothetical protein
LFVFIYLHLLNIESFLSDQFLVPRIPPLVRYMKPEGLETPYVSPGLVLRTGYASMNRFLSGRIHMRGRDEVRDGIQITATASSY